MPEPSVETLRDELRKLGYLSRGIERWFELDPWRSRTFWRELASLAAKGGILLAPFLALPAAVVMAIRNRPFDLTEMAMISGFYLVTAFAFVAMVIVGAALLLRLRPALPVDSPTALTAIAVGTAAALEAAFALWWHAFPNPPGRFEQLAGVIMILLSFGVATIVLSAVFLSFAIHETGKIPSVRQRSRAIPIAAGGCVLLLFLAASTRPQSMARADPPLSIPITPTQTKIALVAVDGLTSELFRARSELAPLFRQIEAVPAPGLSSAPERWASVGSGTAPGVHGVEAVEGVRLRGSNHLIQALSAQDFPLRLLAPGLGLAAKQPIAPTARRREYVWEIAAHRGLPALAVGWWASGSSDTQLLAVIPQERLFAQTDAGSPLARATGIDALAVRQLLTGVAGRDVRLAAVYLPALDIVINRTPSDASSQLSALLRTGDLLRETVLSLRARGFEVILLGLPGEGQQGSGVLATTMTLRRYPRARDVAPTLLDALGFPRSQEMEGRSLLIDSRQGVITTYGARQRPAIEGPADQEYYEQLRSLGYIR
jgi:hypothetical protein